MRGVIWLEKFEARRVIQELPRATVFIGVFQRTIPDCCRAQGSILSTGICAYLLRAPPLIGWNLSPVSDSWASCDRSRAETPDWVWRGGSRCALGASCGSGFRVWPAHCEALLIWFLFACMSTPKRRFLVGWVYA